MGAGRHRVFRLHAHVVFVTYRHRVCTERHLARMEESDAGGVCNDFEVQLVE